jgi:hypothetical protein
MVGNSRPGVKGAHLMDVLMLSCGNKCPVWREAGAGVRGGKGAKRQLTSTKGPGRMGIRHHEQGTAFLSKGIYFSCK